MVAHLSDLEVALTLWVLLHGLMWLVALDLAEGAPVFKALCALGLVVAIAYATLVAHATVWWWLVTSLA